MSNTLEQPDLFLALKPDAFAPRVARQAVAGIDDPSPDLRDALVLVVSNLVTRACRLRPAASEMIGLRAWMPRQLVRIEVEANRNPLEPVDSSDRWPDYDIELLEGLSDRWGIDAPADGSTVVWFEIDRRGSAAAWEPEHHGAAGGA